eukprot:1462225-Ditylum_brightwellii.AAC.1
MGGLSPPHMDAEWHNQFHFVEVCYVMSILGWEHITKVPCLFLVHDEPPEAIFHVQFCKLEWVV